jgi:putative transposase
MARPLRIELAGGFYHIITHGNGRLWLFRNDKQRNHFLNLLGSSALKYNVTIHAFVLMTTHLHLLLETRFQNLSQFMRKLLSDYASSYNRWYRRRGSVFKSRYSSFLVQDDSYYLAASRYIYYNPVKAGIISSPEQYRWSSLYYILHKRIAQKEIKWYNCTAILELIGGRHGLLDLITGDSQKPPIVYGRFMGDKEWADKILNENANELVDEISREREMRAGIVDPMFVVNSIASELDSTAEDIVTGSNKRGRKLCLYILQRETALDARRIAAIFGMRKWAVLKTVQRMMHKKIPDEDVRLMELVKKKMSNVQT